MHSLEIQLLVLSAQAVSQPRELPKKFSFNVFNYFTYWEVFERVLHFKINTIILAASFKLGMLGSLTAISLVCCLKQIPQDLTQRNFCLVVHNLPH